MENLKIKLPVVALRGMTVLPEMITHFDVSRGRSVKAVEQSLKQEQRLFIVAQKNPEEDEPDQEKLFAMGTVAEIKQIVKMPHHILRVLVEGLYRGELLSLEGEEYLEGTVVRTDPEGFGSLPGSGKEAMYRNLKEIFRSYGEGNNKIGKDMLRQVTDSASLESLMVQVMIHTPFTWEQQQQLLETPSLAERYEMLCIMLNNEIEIEQFRRGIQEKVKARVDKNQKDYLLREQMKVIREELGDEGPGAEAEQFRRSVKELKASSEVKERIEKEIQRFLNAGSNSAEASVIRGYIETLLDLPWNKESEDRLDLKAAKKIWRRSTTVLRRSRNVSWSFWL